MHKKDRILTTLTGIALLALNFAPLNEGGGWVLAVLAAGMAALSPPAFVLFISASQVCPEPADFPLTLAQTGVVAWFLLLPWSRWWRGIGAAREMLRSVGGLALVVFPLLTINGTFPLLGVDLLYAFIIAAIVAGYCKSGNLAPRLCLTMLLAGMALAAVGYWGRMLNLPVFATVYQASVGRVLERVGSGRGDANTAGLNLVVALWGTVGLLLEPLERGAKNLRFRTIQILAATAAAIVLVPAAVATGSRMALYQLLGGGALAISLVALRPGQRGQNVLRRVGPWFVVSVVTTGVFLASGLSRSVGEAVREIRATSQMQAVRMGVNSGIAGRYEMWTTHLEILKKYPLTGISRGELWDFGQYGGSVIGVSGIWGAAHNTALEFSSLAGLPGLVAWVWCAVAPPLRVWRRTGPPVSVPIVLTWGVMTLGMMSLSLPGWKSYWSVQAIAVCAGRGLIRETLEAEPTDRRHNPARVISARTMPLPHGRARA